MSIAVGIVGVVQAASASGGSAPTGVSISTNTPLGSPNYNHACKISNDDPCPSPPFCTTPVWINEDGSNFSSQSLQLVVPTNFSSVNAYEYGVHPNGVSGYTKVEIFGYCGVTSGNIPGTTEFTWDFTLVSNGSSGVGSVSVISEASGTGAQDRTSNAAIEVRFNGISGGRGYLPWLQHEIVEFDVDCTASNGTGLDTAAPTLTIELEGSG